MPPFATLKKYDGVRGPELLGTMWTLGKSGHKLQCHLRTHWVGWELTRELDAARLMVRVTRTESEALAIADGWKTDAIGRGWLK